MILPVCKHTMPTKAKLGEAPPPATGWIFTCREDFEQAVRANLVVYADAMLPIKLEKELIAARGRIQKLESDVEDMRMATRAAFIRCDCGRLRVVSKPCRVCGE